MRRRPVIDRPTQIHEAQRKLQIHQPQQKVLIHQVQRKAQQGPNRQYRLIRCIDLKIVNWELSVHSAN